MPKKNPFAPSWHPFPTGHHNDNGCQSRPAIPIQSATIILACMWVGDYCMTSQSIHNGQGHSTGQSVANRSPAGTRWPDQDGVLSRRVSGLQRGKVTERCGNITSFTRAYLFLHFENDMQEIS